MNQPKLTIELVPRSCWNKNVRSQLTDVEWDIIRHRVYARASGNCEICETKTQKLHAHEVWEYNETTRVQKLVALCGICERCHEVKHYGRSQVVGRREAAYEWLLKVNNWHSSQADIYITEVWGDWMIRNDIKKWRLDIHYLKEFMEQ